MNPSIAALRDRARSPLGQKAVRYAMVSVVAVAVSLSSLAFFYGVLHWAARPANVGSFVVGTIPSYYLNRTWAWGKSGRSHLWREVVPYWTLAFLGLAFSTVTAGWAEDLAHSWFDSRAAQTLVVMAGSLSAYGTLWVAKFIIINKVIFASHPEDLLDEPALDGRTGIPT